jgi:gas vesicle protein
MIIRLLPLAIGLAIGYVLGTKDGTTRLDALRKKLSPIIDDPRVVRARKDVETYAKQQAPIIRERAETAVKDAASATAETAKDVAGKVQTTAKDVAGKVSETASDVVDQVGKTAADVREQAAKTASDVQKQAAKTAADVRDQVGKTAADLRERGEDLIDRTLQTAGNARDAALDVFDDEDDDKPAAKK